MNDRRELILNTIIKEHIKTGAPVGSGILVKKYNINVSPATVRNEMSALEEEGYIMQPHTSAGRIPTEEAYRYYLQNSNGKRLNSKDKEALESIFIDSERQNLKNVAKEIARISNLGVFWAFHKNDLYYTGISNLFVQPEFRELNVVYDISSIIDRLDEIISEEFDNINEGIDFMIGAENPFGSFLSTVYAKYKHTEGIGLFGIIGPVRMDYEYNLAIADFINSKLIDR